MSTKMIHIIDHYRTVVATAQVIKQEGRFTGRIDLHAMPVDLRQTFEEYEEIINGQMFSYLDEIEEQISAMQFSVIFDDGDEANIENLQIYPTTNRISFKLVKEPTQLAIKELIIR